MKPPRLLYLSLLVENSSEELSRVAAFAKPPLLDLEWWFETALLRREWVEFVHIPSFYAFENRSLSLLDGITGVIAGGSIYSVHERRPWQERAAAFLMAVIRRQIPILGVCGGHQLLANSTGYGSVIPKDSYTLSYDQVVISEDGQDDPLLEGLPRTFVAPFSYGEAVEPTRCLAYTALCTCAVARYSQGPAWGIQFHPELSFDRMRHISTVRAQRLVLPRRGVEMCWSQQVVRNFLRLTNS